MRMSQADKERFARENHSEIERRRRNKMTAYITELSDMVPSCSALARKPDKLTILRMAVSHMKQLRGLGGNGLDKPAFLTDQELKHLVLESADGFLFVVSCETGQVTFVSDTVTPVLNQAHSDWMNHRIYDLIHPQDVAKVQEQMMIEDSSNAGRMLDLKTGAIKKESMLSSEGTRRAFICRMRCGKLQVSASEPRYRLAEGHIMEGENIYALTHVTGYIKPWPPSGYNGDELQAGIMDELTAQSQLNGEYCLVGIARLQIPSNSVIGSLAPPNDITEFVSRHNFDNVFTYIDARVSNILGYQPRDLIGKRPVDFCHPDDTEKIAESFKQVMQLKGQMFSTICRFQAHNAEYIWLRLSSYAFQNPYNNEVEYIVSNYSLVKQNQNNHRSVEEQLSSHSRAEQSYIIGSNPSQSPDIQSPTATLNYPPQNVSYAAPQSSHYSTTPTGTLAPGWNPVDPSSSDYPHALLDRYQGVIATQHSHADIPASNLSYAGFSSDGRQGEYPSQETMMSMLEHGVNNHPHAEFTELFTPFSAS
uniref:aryl hydrocarbon receptor nuclear translocator-like n=1 Tax=Styela clava TaxID=7725 RepID=UPI001939BA87|nr:aryl hydrocarbon receptor nuclear translocator-like [Styela clava]